MTGRVQGPEMGDQTHMPFTMAVVHEVQRFGDIIPNLSSVLKDEKVWKKAFPFHPEHFLDAHGRFVRQEAFVPFSAGAWGAQLAGPLRRTPGPPHRPPHLPRGAPARMELFLFFTCLLQRFSFSVPAGQPRPSDHRVFSCLVTPAPSQLCAVPR